MACDANQDYDDHLGRTARNADGTLVAAEFDPRPLDPEDPEWDLLGRAWGLICNAHHTTIDVQPADASPGWSDAAVWWRDQYHALLQARSKLRAVQAAAFHLEGLQRRAVDAETRLWSAAADAEGLGATARQIEDAITAGRAAYRAKNPQEAPSA